MLHFAWIIHSTSNEGLSYVDTSERYMYSYETIKSIAKENGQVVPKHKGDVRYPILQDEHNW